MTRTRRDSWSLFTFCALAALGCQAAVEDPGTDSNTNWLDSCQSNEQCDGPYSCLCGVCTLACSDVGDCDNTPGPAECRLSDEGNGCPTAVCLRVNDGNALADDDIVVSDDTLVDDDVGPVGSAGAVPSMGGASNTDGGCETPLAEGSCRSDGDCRADQVCLGGPVTECDSTRPESLGTCSVATCGNLDAPCTDGEVCVLTETSLFDVYRSWACVPNPCMGEPLSCNCADSICQGSSVCYFVGPVEGRDYTADVSCFSISDCAAPDTPIATPFGNRPISSLEEGDLVYTLDDFGVRAVPLLQARSKPALDHSVLRILFDSGAEWTISADHPTADGRLLLDLEPGERIHDETIVSIEQIPYEFERTYDILPASPSGVYFADGVPVGSTLLGH